MTNAEETRRQVLYWRMLAKMFDPAEQPTLETASAAMATATTARAATAEPILTAIGRSANQRVRRVATGGGEAFTLVLLG